MKVELTKSEVNHILNLIWMNEQHGEYIGNHSKFKELREGIRTVHPKVKIYEGNIVHMEGMH